MSGKGSQITETRLFVDKLFLDNKEIVRGPRYRPSVGVIGRFRAQSAESVSNCRKRLTDMTSSPFRRESPILQQNYVSR